MRKYKITGAILCAAGFIFASGDTLENAIIALLCMAVGVVTYKYARPLAYMEERRRKGSFIEREPLRNAA